MLQAKHQAAYASMFSMNSKQARAEVTLQTVQTSILCEHIAVSTVWTSPDTWDQVCCTWERATGNEPTGRHAKKKKYWVRTMEVVLFSFSIT
jgi:hypothetical protein